MGAVHNFRAPLTPLAGKPNLRFLQLGVFTGNASVWLMRNVLTDHSSTLDDVDTWEGSDDIEGIDFTEVESTYDAQTRPYHARITKHRMESGEYLASLPREHLYDFIYIDGDHTALAVLNDAVDSYHRLKVGGIMAFDDYSWRIDGDPLHHPYPSIDAFFSLYADRMGVFAVNAQVWARKLK